MKGFSRRSILKSLSTLPALWALGSARTASAESLEEQSRSHSRSPVRPTQRRKAKEVSDSKEFAPGYLSIVQGPTSDREALFNVFAPRLKKYTYEILDANGNKLAPTKYETIKGPGFFKQSPRSRGSLVT